MLGITQHSGLLNSLDIGLKGKKKGMKGEKEPIKDKEFVNNELKGKEKLYV